MTDSKAPQTTADIDSVAEAESSALPEGGASIPPPSGDPAGAPAPRASLLLTLGLLALLAAAIVAFAVTSVRRNARELWFANQDQDGELVVSALMVNDGRIPNFLAHPGMGAHLFNSAGFRVMSAMGLVRTGRYSQIEAAEDPLPLLPEVFLAGRKLSIVFAVLTALAFGAACWAWTRRFGFFVLGAGALLGAGGIFFQSLVLRTELASVFWLALTLFFLALEARSDDEGWNRLWLVLAGGCLGLAVVSKVQVLPALGFVAGLLVLSVLARREKERPGSLRGDRLAMGVAWLLAGMGLLAAWLAFRQDKLGFPLLLTGIALLAVAGELIAFLAGSWRTHKSVAWLPKLGLVAMGMLAGTQIALFFLNFESTLDPRTAEVHTRSMLSMAYRFGQTKSVYAASLGKGQAPVIAQFGQFVGFYAKCAWYLPAIGALAVLAVAVRRRFPSVLALLATCAGLVMCLFSAMRYYALWYHCYGDLFFCAAIVLLSAQVLGVGPGRAVPPAWRAVVGGLLAVFVVASAFNQFSYVSRMHAERTSRDRPDVVVTMTISGPVYRDMLLKRYCSADKIVRRVCNDPVLNGTEQGIVLRDRPAAAKYCGRYFDPPIAAK